MSIIREILYWVCVAGMITTAMINLACADSYRRAEKALDQVMEDAKHAKALADDYLRKAMTWNDRD